MTGRTFVLPENAAFAQELIDSGCELNLDTLPAECWPRPEEFSEDFADLPFLPIGHYALPGDPSKRTALCLRDIAGIPTGDTPFVMCPACEFLMTLRSESGGKAMLPVRKLRLPKTYEQHDQRSGRNDRQ